MVSSGLLGLSVQSGSPAETAVLLGLKSVRMVLLFLGHIVVSLLALSAGKGDLNTHLNYLLQGLWPPHARAARLFYPSAGLLCAAILATQKKPYGRRFL